MHVVNEGTSIIKLLHGGNFVVIRWHRRLSCGVTSYDKVGIVTTLRFHSRLSIKSEDLQVNRSMNTTHTLFCQTRWITVNQSYIWHTVIRWIGAKLIRPNISEKLSCNLTWELRVCFQVCALINLFVFTHYVSALCWLRAKPLLSIISREAATCPWKFCFDTTDAIASVLAAFA